MRVRGWRRLRDRRRLRDILRLGRGGLLGLLDQGPRGELPLAKGRQFRKELSTDLGA
jgi:hypothetical protein